MKIGYVRVSTIEQNEGRQLKALEKYDLDKTFIEKASASERNRPILNEMLDYAREGDVIYIVDFSRIARSTKDLLEIVELLQKKDVKLISIKENLDTNTATGKLMLTMLGAIYEFERSNLLERQKEGIALAQEQGKYRGRKEIKIDDHFIRQYNRYLVREITTKKALSEILDISRPTLNKLIEEYEEKKEINK